MNIKDTTKHQQKIIRIIFPIVILILASRIADGQDKTDSIFNWNETWLTWLFTVLIIGGFEFWMNNPKEKEI